MREERHVLEPDPGARGELGLALAALEEVRARTKRAVARLDAEALAARPPGGGPSAGALLRHVALVELDWILTDVGRGEAMPDDAPGILRTEGAMTEPGRRPPSEFLAALDYARAVTRDRLGRLPPEEAGAERTYADAEVRRTFNVRWILHHLLVHEAHHLGQIARTVADRAREEGPRSA